MIFWLTLIAAATICSAAPVEHYGYDFHVSSDNELEPLADTSYQSYYAQPVYVRPTFYAPQRSTFTTTPTSTSASAGFRQQSSGEPSSGRWSWGYDTDNGISVAEEGELRSPSYRSVDNPGAEPSPVVRGRYSYTGPDGRLYTVTYYADETGFHPSGTHLPASALRR